ncbi:MAG: M67 family metallopeptidase [Chitinophagaceae bacterium]|nr:M67 family metallopeptidase [Chitinophagaceae bacterium]
MLVLDKTIFEQLKSEAADIFPDECCGFLFGSETNGERIISVIRPALNNKEGDKRRRFEISPKDYLQAERFATANNVTLLGIYHSHPQHPALPSETDRLAAQPFFSYLIIPVKDQVPGAFRSWLQNEEHYFDEETIIINL